MIKYIGSKRRLVPLIVELIDSVPRVRSVLDLFSGTARVGKALKSRGYRVTANDHNAYAWVLARAYVQADAKELVDAAGPVLAQLGQTVPSAGWFTEMFCRRSRYIHPDNGAHIEAIRRAIRDLDPAPDLEAVLLTALLEAADRVDSTTGVQMAYLKQWAPRALKPLELRMPDLVEGRGVALFGEALEAASHPVDLAYLDPPYNQHSYLGNYHVWETLVRWDEPETYGVACKRIDCRTQQSPFNRRASIQGAMQDVLDRLDARHVLVSFNDEGFLTRAQLEDMLSAHGEVRVLEVEGPRYVGAKIGIHNLKGERVGQVGRLRNREYLFFASPDPEAIAAVETLQASHPSS